MRVSPATQKEVIGLLEEVAFAIDVVHRENHLIESSGGKDHAFACESYTEESGQFWKHRTAKVVLPCGTWIYVGLHEPHNKMETPQMYAVDTVG